MLAYPALCPLKGIMLQKQDVKGPRGADTGWAKKSTLEMMKTKFLIFRKTLFGSKDVTVLSLTSRSVFKVWPAGLYFVTIV